MYDPQAYEQAEIRVTAQENTVQENVKEEPYMPPTKVQEGLHHLGTQIDGINLRIATLNRLVEV